MFRQVQSLRGELKRSEIRGDARYQLTTKEFVFQRGLNTYRIALEHVLGFIKCRDEEFLRYAHLSSQTYSVPTGDPYKIVLTMMHVVSPVGVVEQHRMTFYIRLSQGMASQFENLLKLSA